MMIVRFAPLVLAAGAGVVAMSGGAAAQVAGPAAPGAPRMSRATPAEGVSRNAPVNGVLVLYGNERCPTNANGEEIVVCSRRSADEQFRIPKEVRTLEVTPQNENWAVREAANRDTGNVGIGSCSTVGAGGQIGCNGRFVRRNKAERKAEAKAGEPILP